MAAAFATPRPPKFVAILNAPQIVAIAAIPGKMVPSMGDDAPSEVCFTLVDGRSLYFPQIIANEICRERFYEKDAQHEAAGEGCSFHRRPIMPPDYIDPETGCTAAEMKEEETGWACPIDREICDGVETGRPLREDAVYPKGKVA
jgi:hypothetical protein